MIKDVTKKGAVMKYFVMIIMAFVYSVQADFIAQYKMGDDIYKFYYKDDNHTKLRSNGDICENGELYKIGKKIYSVSFANGELVVMNLSKLKSFMDLMGAQNEIDTQDIQTITDEYDITKTRQSKMIGNIKAYKWILRAKDGSADEITLYVTNNHDAVKVTKAMIEMFSAFSPDTDSSIIEIEKGYVVVVGDGMELLDLKASDVPSSTYKLPTKHSRIAKQCKKKVSQAFEKKEHNSVQPAPPTTQEIQKSVDMFKALF